MNKAELIDQSAKEFCMSKKQAGETLESFTSAVVQFRTVYN